MREKSTGWDTKLFRKRLTTALGALVVVILAATGCASRGEGFSLGGDDGLVIGTSLSKRDQIAQDKADAELDQVRARTVIEQDRAAAGIEQSAQMGTVTRPVVLGLGLAAALVVVAIGGGYALQTATPMAKQGVAALGLALEVRKARRLEVIMEIGPGGYSAKLLTTGYDPAEIAQIVKAAPALNAPALASLQSRVGARGVKALLANGELEAALARLPI